MATLATDFPALGFLGAGNMASALLRGTVGRGLLAADSVRVCDKIPEKTSVLSAELGIQAVQRPEDLARASTAIVLAVKPQDLPKLLDEIAPSVSERHLMISIAAGVRSAAIAARLPAGARVVRVMPNTPALVGVGAAGVAAGPGASEADVAATLNLFRAVGIARAVEEEALDAVTALSGSGPAYIFRIMEILSEAATALGLDAEVARELTLQTVLGAATLATQSKETPAELRARVTSPGGTTAAALAVFEERGLAEILAAGMRRARDRSVELSSQT